MKAQLGILMAVFLLMTVSGCSTTPQADRFRGVATELAKHSQAADPAAGTIHQDVTGMDGEVGKHVMDRYKAGFVRQAPKTETYSISVEGANISSQAGGSPAGGQ